MFALPLRVDEPECSDPVIRVAGETRREGFGSLHEAKGNGMRTEELFDGLGRWNIRAAGEGSAQELEELRAVARREAVCRVADDIGMHMFSKVESNGKAPRIGVGRVVRDCRNAC